MMTQYSNREYGLPSGNLVKNRGYTERVSGEVKVPKPKSDKSNHSSTRVSTKKRCVILAIKN